MSTRIPLPGASYVDALPSGAFAALYEGSHIQTHLGRVELPPGEGFGLMFLRCSEINGFRFVGKLHDASPSQRRQWAGAWLVPQPTETGYCVYDHAGVVRDTFPAGYQFTADDGIPVSRIETYPPVDGISNWTLTAGFRIGQGHDGGGCRVFVDGVLRELESGPCWFVNANRDGERIAIAFWKTSEGAVIWQTTLEELRALPPVETTPPDPEPPDPEPPEPEPEPPDPEPEPEPEPPPVEPYYRAQEYL